MKLLALTCHHCGAPIQVPANARSTTCEFCASKLTVKSQRNKHETETLEAMHNELTELRVKERMRTLDEDWRRRRKRLMVQDKQGRSHVPTTGGAMTIAVLATIFGFFAAIFLTPIVLVGVVPFRFIATHHYTRAVEYERQHRRYLNRRRDVARKLRRDSSEEAQRLWGSATPS